MTKDQTENQTLFAEEQPYFDVDAFADNFIDPEKPKKSKKNLIVLGVVGIMVIIVIILTIIRLLPKNTGNPVATPSASPTAPDSLTGLDILFQELDVEIKKADPTINVLPFPPVEGLIIVTPEKR